VVICNEKKSQIYFANFEGSCGIKSSIVRIGVQLVKTDNAAGAPSHSRQALVCIVVTYDENLKKNHHAKNVANIGTFSKGVGARKLGPRADGSQSARIRPADCV
jgi:hypothetical protein